MGSYERRKETGYRFTNVMLFAFTGVTMFIKES